MGSVKEAEAAEDDYVVEAVKDKKYRNGTPFYLIKWQDYPEEESTWEPLRNCLGALKLIREFEAKQQLPERNESARHAGRVLKPIRARETQRKTHVGKTSKRLEEPAKRDLKHAAIRAGETRKKTDVGETSKRFGELSINIENCATNSEPVPERGTAQSMDVDFEENQTDGQCSAKPIPGQKPKRHSDRRSINDTENMNPMQDAFYSDLETTSNNRCSMVPAKSIPANEYTIEKLKRCSSTEIEIVGAEPSDQGVTIGVRALDDDNVFTFDSREVTALWPQPYVTFLESHIQFDSDEGEP